MHVEVVAFAALRESLGRSRVRLELPEGARAGDVRDHLSRAHPELAELIRACRLARGVHFVDEGSALEEGSEVVLIPPVSGGNLGSAGTIPAVALAASPLDGDALKRAATRDSAGAVVVFEGTVRSPSEGKVVDHLEYEAYQEMALAQMGRIVEEATGRWGLAAAFLHHRLGRIEVGEASVVIVTASPHRPEAFAACRWIIEQLKADVPIWKKEFFEDGSVWVGAPGECRHEPC